MQQITQIKKQAGFSLLEIMVYFIIAAIAAALIYQQYQKAKVSQNVDAESKNLQTLLAGMEQLSTGGNYAESTLANLKTAKVLPSSVKFNPAGDKILPSFGHGSEITIDVTTDATNPTISYSALTTEECVKFVTASSSIVSGNVTVGGTTVRNADGAISGGSVATQCAVSNSNAVVFKMN